MKTNIEKAQAAKQQKSLEKTFMFEGKSITRKKFVEIATAREYKFEIKLIHKKQYPSNRVFNRMCKNEQKIFEKERKDAGFKNDYRVYFPDGTFYTITKYEYDYHHQLMSN